MVGEWIFPTNNNTSVAGGDIIEGATGEAAGDSAVAGGESFQAGASTTSAFPIGADPADPNFDGSLLV